MRKRLVGMFASTLIVFAACQAAATPSPASPTPGSAAPGSVAPSESPAGVIDLTATKYAEIRTDGQKGGEIVWSDWQEATLFQPYYSGQVTESNVFSTTWNSLILSTHDFRYAPDLAAEIPTLDNGGVAVGEGGDAMTVTWKLKPDLKWSDGTPLTCDDYKFTHDWIMDPDNTGLYGGISGYEDVTNFECVSDTDMVIHFGKVYEGYLGMYAWPLQRAYFSKIPVKDQVTGAGTQPADMPNVPVSGAFKFESITPGQELRVIRNDNYLSPWTGEPAYLDRIIFKWYADADAMIAGYRAGEHDIATDLSDGDIPKVTDLGDQMVVNSALDYEFLRPNWNPDVCSPRVTDRGTGCPVSDPAIREAVRWAINKDDINTRVLGGNAAIGFTNVSPFAYYYIEPPPYSFDPAKAISVLEAAGWVDADGDGVREKGGLKAKIELCTTTRQSRQDTLALVSAWLKDVGIEATVNAVSPDDIFATFNEGTDDTPCNLSRHKFDIAEHAFSVPLDPLGNYGVYHSSQEAPNGQNDASIKTPEIDAIMDGVKGTVDFVEIKKLMADWQTLYVEQTVEIPLYFRKNVELVSPKVQNFTGNPTNQGPTWNAVDFYVTQ